MSPPPSPRYSRSLRLHVLDPSDPAIPPRTTGNAELRLAPRRDAAHLDYTRRGSKELALLAAATPVARETASPLFERDQDAVGVAGVMRPGSSMLKS